MHADLLLLLGREHVHHPIDRLSRVVRMQGGEHQVAGFRDRDRRRYGLEVAHLADQEHVGCLAQGGSQGVGEGGDIGADLALLDDTALVPVDVLDGILDGDHVTGPGGNDVVDHRRQGGGLPGAGRSCYQDQALAETGQAANDRRHAELVEVRDLVRNQAQGQADGAALFEGIDPKARLPSPVEGEVEVALRLETSPALRGKELPGHLLDLVRAKRVPGDGRQGAVLPHGRGGAGGEDQVGRRLLQQDLEVGVDDQGVLIAQLARRRH